MNSYLTVHIPPSAMKASLLMLCIEIIAVCCQNQTQHTCIFYTVRTNWTGKDKGKVQPRTRQERPRRGTIMGWVVKATPRPLYPQERPGTHCTGGWVGTGVALDGFENLAPTEIRSLDRPARNESQYRLRYPGNCRGV